jgi:hypothetical protein
MQPAGPAASRADDDLSAGIPAGGVDALTAAVSGVQLVSGMTCMEIIIWMKDVVLLTCYHRLHNVSWLRCKFCWNWILYQQHVCKLHLWHNLASCTRHPS